MPRHKNIKEAKLLKDGYLDKGIKKGVPLYSNLVNLKSNAMKNTMQRYALNPILPNISVKNTSYLYTFNTLSPLRD